MATENNLPLLETLFDAESVFILNASESPDNWPTVDEMCCIRTRKDLVSAINLALYGSGIRFRSFVSIEWLKLYCHEKVYRIRMVCFNQKSVEGRYSLYLHRLFPATEIAKRIKPLDKWVVPKQMVDFEDLEVGPNDEHQPENHKPTPNSKPSLSVNRTTTELQ
jgi:hypothetical protein